MYDVMSNLVFHPSFDIIALVAEVKILDRVLQILATDLQGRQGYTKKIEGSIHSHDITTLLIYHVT